MATSIPGGQAVGDDRGRDRLHGQGRQRHGSNYHGYPGSRGRALDGAGADGAVPVHQQTDCRPHTRRSKHGRSTARLGWRSSIPSRGKVAEAGRLDYQRRFAGVLPSPGLLSRSHGCGRRRRERRAASLGMARSAPSPAGGPRVCRRGPCANAAGLAARDRESHCEALARGDSRTARRHTFTRSCAPVFRPHRGADGRGAGQHHRASCGAAGRAATDVVLWSDASYSDISQGVSGFALWVRIPLAANQADPSRGVT